MTKNDFVFQGLRFRRLPNSSLFLTVREVMAPCPVHGGIHPALEILGIPEEDLGSFMMDLPGNGVASA